MLTARDIMSKAVQRLERGTKAIDAASAMANDHVGSIIVTAGGYPVGIVTETDITRLVAAGADVHNTAIESIMSSPLFSTSPDTEVIQIANTMSANRIKKMPVVERQQVIGIITQTDIIKYILHSFTELRKDLNSGAITQKDFEEQSKYLFTTARLSTGDEKEWHMLCKSCGLRFLNEERSGKLAQTVCPRCGGEIAYDLAPPI